MELSYGQTALVKVMFTVCVYRGFGFVIYKDPTAVDKVLSGGPHQLDSKIVCHFLTALMHICVVCINGSEGAIISESNDWQMTARDSAVHEIQVRSMKRRVE